MKVLVALCNPMDYSPPGSSVHRIFQTRILEWIAISFSRGSSQPRDRTQVSRIAGRFFTSWATGEALWNSENYKMKPTSASWMEVVIFFSLLQYTSYIIHPGALKNEWLPKLFEFREKSFPKIKPVFPPAMTSTIWLRILLLPVTSHVGWPCTTANGAQMACIHRVPTFSCLSVNAACSLSPPRKWNIRNHTPLLDQ